MQQFQETFKSKMYLEEYFVAKGNSITEEGEPEDYLGSIYSCFVLLQNLSKPIKYDEISKQDGDHYFIKNVLVLGNVGNGKSTTLNKLATYLQLGGKNVKTLKQEFKASSGTESVTTEVMSKIF
jgi:signal recognition particle GTPase